MAYKTRRKLDYTPDASVLFDTLRFAAGDPSPAFSSVPLTLFFGGAMVARFSGARSSLRTQLPIYVPCTDISRLVVAFLPV